MSDDSDDRFRITIEVEHRMMRDDETIDEFIASLAHAVNSKLEARLKEALEGLVRNYEEKQLANRGNP